MFTQSMHSEEVHCSTVVYSVAQFDLDVDIWVAVSIDAKDPLTRAW